MFTPPYGNTLNELSQAKAPPFVEQIDNITAHAPIVKAMPFIKASTDQLWDVAPDLALAYSLEAGFSAEVFVPEDTAHLEGGPEQYFSKNRKELERLAGMTVERDYLYNAFIPFILSMNKAGGGSAQNAGGAANANYSLICIRFDNDNFTGLFSSLAFKGEAFLDVKSVNGLYKQNDSNLLGYGFRMNTYMGVRMLSRRNVGGIFNIDLNTVAPLTKMMVEKMLLSARIGETGKAMIMCHPAVKRILEDFGKVRKVQMHSTEYNAYGGQRAFAGITSFSGDDMYTWDGVPIVTSYNFMNGSETNIAL